MGILSDILGQNAPASFKDDTGSIARIEKELASYPPDRAQFLAAFAMLLGRVAHADSNISDGEEKAMREVLQKHASLSEPESHVVSTLAVEQTLTSYGEDHLFIRKIKESTEREERVKIIESLFVVAKEDDISSRESEEIKLIAKGLGFDHSEFIEIRSKFREHLAVLKGAP